MFNEYDEVTIKINNMNGIIIDKTEINGITRYTVEGNSPDYSSVPTYNGDNPIYDCSEDEIMPRI